MFLREIEPLTVSQLSDKLDQGGDLITVSPGNLKLDSAAGVIEVLPEGENRRNVRRIPISVESVEAIANHLQVPTAFHKRLPADLRDTLVNEMFSREHNMAHVRLNDSEIFYVREPSSKVIDPRRFIDVAAKVISPA